LKDLSRRTVTGIIYVAIMIAGVAVHPVLFALVFGVLLFLTQLEFYQLVEKAGSSPRKNTGLTLGVLLFLTCFGIVNNLLPVRSYLLFIPALTFIFLYETFSQKPGILSNSSITFTGFIYVAIPFSLLNFMVHPGYPAFTEFNSKILLGIFLLVWTYDSMAYLIGSKLGRNKIYEKISPNKTWEGFIGGAVFTIAAGILCSLILNHLTLTDWIVIASIVIIFGTLGDLFESIIKRRLNVKDSGTMLPGHGGLLDRFDSLLFVIPVVFVWLSLTGNF
jgi:phosphatidate cytidylyltransferase